MNMYLTCIINYDMTLGLALSQAMDTSFSSKWQPVLRTTVMKVLGLILLQRVCR